VLSTRSPLGGGRWAVDTRAVSVFYDSPASRFCDALACTHIPYTCIPRDYDIRPTQTRPEISQQKPKTFCRSTTVADGSHNVSRWMTWLPISLKNAAKCDKWYQLQNHSITESLNANGAWKKALVVQLQACHVSVSNKNQKLIQGRFSSLLESDVAHAMFLSTGEWLSRCARLSGLDTEQKTCLLGWGACARDFIFLASHALSAGLGSNKDSRVLKKRTKTSVLRLFFPTSQGSSFETQTSPSYFYDGALVHRPERGRTTRRT
jgi:hypothetical protein